MKHLHLDFAEIEGWQVLVIVDVHSKWIEAMPLHKATAATTISAFANLLCQFWVPRRNYDGQWPPIHSSSVQVVKQAMRKMGASKVLKDRLAKFLLIYRSTPHGHTGYPL